MSWLIEVLRLDGARSRIISAGHDTLIDASAAVPKKAAELGYSSPIYESDEQGVWRARDLNGNRVRFVVRLAKEGERP